MHTNKAFVRQINIDIRYDTRYGVSNHNNLVQSYFMCKFTHSTQGHLLTFTVPAAAILWEPESQCEKMNSKRLDFGTSLVV